MFYLVFDFSLLWFGWARLARGSRYNFNSFVFVRSYAVRPFNYCYGDVFGMSCGGAFMTWSSAIHKRKSVGCFCFGKFVCSDGKNRAGFYFRKAKRLSGGFRESVGKFDEVHFLLGWWRGDRTRAGGGG